MSEISSLEMENLETIPKTCKGLITPNESGSESDEDQTSEMYQKINGKHQRKFLLSLSLWLDVNTA